MTLKNIVPIIELIIVGVCTLGCLLLLVQAYIKALKDSRKRTYRVSIEYKPLDPADSKNYDKYVSVVTLHWDDGSGSATFIVGCRKCYEESCKLRDAVLEKIGPYRLLKYKEKRINEKEPLSHVCGDVTLVETR